MSSTTDPPVLSRLMASASSAAAAASSTSSSSSSSGYNPSLNGPSTTVFAYAFVAVALAAVAVAGFWRCIFLRRSAEPFFPAMSVFNNYDDQWYGMGYIGSGAFRYGGPREYGGGKGLAGVRPRVLEVEIEAEREKMEGWEPLAAVVPISRPNQSPHLYLTVLVLPPSEVPLRPLERYPNGRLEEMGEDGLPEIELGTFAVSLAFEDEKGGGREAWAEVRRRGRKEDKEWEEQG